MAGTDKARDPVLGGPAVVLVDPQLGENIGMVARAMLNCGLDELRLVRPRDGWPNPAAVAAASGADRVLARARLFDDTAAALADLRRVYAATARSRDMVKPVVTPRRAAGEMHAAAGRGEAVGLLFGPERSGLTNDDVALADTLLAVPLNPAFASLNLAQAVLVIGYEWFQAADDTTARRLETCGAAPADKAELVNFFDRLEGALDETGFLHPPEKRAGMVRNLRNMIQRMAPTDQDLRTLHGIISALKGGPGRGRGGEGP
jgi:tRNA/rRNA methyltransferase